MTEVPKKVNRLNDIFKDTYREESAAINGVIYTKTGDRETAEDLTQEVFIEFFLNMETIEKTRAWLYTTMRNKLFDYYRKKKNMPENLARLEASGDIALTYINGFKDTRIIIQEAMESIAEIMDNRDVTIFELIAVQNYSYRETAKTLGTSKGNVEYRYSKVVSNILDFLRGKKGIKTLEELL
ncbi:MAG: sigma-70 family RNA polymerase sigma factor [bacterium]|nr:sigma-70 family RNA polymerase sigma factor [bacterium]